MRPRRVGDAISRHHRMRGSSAQRKRLSTTSQTCSRAVRVRTVIRIEWFASLSVLRSWRPLCPCMRESADSAYRGRESVPSYARIGGFSVQGRAAVPSYVEIMRIVTRGRREHTSKSLEFQRFREQGNGIGSRTPCPRMRKVTLASLRGTHGRHPVRRDGPFRHAGRIHPGRPKRRRPTIPVDHASIIRRPAKGPFPRAAHVVAEMVGLWATIAG